jgi:hypothetical protein
VTQWLYRVLENDDDGDPLDFGVVQAESLLQAQARVAAHLKELGTAGWYGGELAVRFYEITGYDANGIAASDGHFVTVTLDIPKEGAE